LVGASSVLQFGYGTQGVPSTGNYGVNGTCIQYNPASPGSLNSNDYSVGIATNELWHNVASNGSYSWRFGGLTQMSLTGGTLVLNNNLNAPGVICNSIKAGGHYCNQGITGATFGNRFNFWWSGSACQLWIDNTNIGNLSTTSDYRVKQNVQPLAHGASKRVAALKPVPFQYRNTSIFKASSAVQTGFIADQVQQALGCGCIGNKDAVDANGDMVSQSLDMPAFVSTLVKAVQELSTTNTLLINRVHALEQ
jgi:hypothetical protein